VASLDEISGGVDTVTVYVNAKISDAEYERIINLKPRRVIFNPGAENEPLAVKLEEQGIEVVRACTLVMLRTGQF
jgi:predicted CoA-binding protein